MSQILFDIIVDKVYKEEGIQEVSLNSTDKKEGWIFDFKSQTLSKVFIEEYARAFWSIFPHDSINSVQIGGMETGAIALIAGISLFAPETVKVNSFYIRKSRKKGGLANLIEGDLNSDPIILVDDLINNGRTFRKQVLLLKEQGHSVSSLFTCLRFRDMIEYQDFISEGIKVVSIFELNDFSKVLPVRNLKKDFKDIKNLCSYTVNYKVTLTKKPNLYIVVPKSAPVLVGDFLYLGVDDGTFYCLSKKDGAVIWTYLVMFGSEGKRIFSSPVIYKDKVFFGAYDGNFYCLNRFTGKREWVFSDADWIGSSPCVDVDRGIVFVGLEFGLFKKRGGVVAIEIKSGKALWKNYTMEGLTHASPAYNKKTNVVVCGCNDNYVYAFDAKTGSILWKYKTEGHIKYGAIFYDKKSLVIIGSMDGGLYVLNINDGSLYHKFEARYGFYSTAVLYGDYLIIGSLDKNVYCFDILSKKVKWTVETFGRIFASPILDGNKVFVGSNDGRLYDINAKTGESNMVVQLSERIVNRIQVDYEQAKRVLYIPTHTGELYKLIEK